MSGIEARLDARVERIVALLGKVGKDGLSPHPSLYVWLRDERGELANYSSRSAYARRAMVESAVAHIQRAAVVTARAEKKYLTRAAADLRRAARSLDEAGLWDERALLGELDRAALRCEGLAEKICVKRSGGRGGPQLAAQKRIAADEAFDLLLDYGERTPTLTKGGDYFKLAGMLFEAATGRRSDLTRACLEHFKELRADGLFDAAELRRMKRGAGAPLTWPRSI